MLSSSNDDSALWIYPPKNPDLVENIAKEFKIHPVIAQILISRGFTTFEQIHKYLYAKLPDLYDPFLIAQMPQAVERICRAIKDNENILIYGDNDVDGMTGTTLLTEFFQQLGCNVFFYVSHRGTLRQSLIVEALEYALMNECKLIITVDCGITAAAEIAKVAEKNVDVIITDHHEPTDKMPHCVATLNPKLVNSTYPNRELTGVGVAFKLVHALTNQLTAEGILAPKKIDLKRFLDLVALGTISDMGALIGENRTLVKYGLLQIQKGKRMGLAKLLSLCDVNLSDLSTFTIASKIAPRLNSLGRIDDPRKGVQMLLVKNSVLAEKMAVELDLNNIERQKIERTMSTDVDGTISLQPDILNNKAIVMTSDKWHPGVIAIISARISKQYNRPTIMIVIDDKGIGKGSVRSIREFPLLSVLKESSDILLNFGGHDFAAGLTIKEEFIPEFKRRFIEAANKQLKDIDVMNKLHLDAEVAFNDLTFDFMESIKLLEPYGNENPPPILYSSAKQAWPPKVIGKTHLKMYLEQNERVLEGIALGKATYAQHLRKKDLELEIAFTPQVNKSSIQLLIKDLRIIKETSESHMSTNAPM